jgi:hypothetical protein
MLKILCFKIFFKTVVLLKQYFKTWQQNVLCLFFILADYICVSYWCKHCIFFEFYSQKKTRNYISNGLRFHVYICCSIWSWTPLCIHKGFNHIFSRCCQRRWNVSMHRLLRKSQNGVGALLDVIPSLADVARQPHSLIIPTGNWIIKIILIKNSAYNRLFIRQLWWILIVMPLV